jgi:hypothetical protein
MEIKFKIRDLRKKEQFIVDDAYLNGYAKMFGPNGTAVYLSLCRRANKEQYCFPSERLIAKDHGLTEKTARKYLRLIEKANIIRIEKERRQDGKYKCKTYYLIDKSEWKHPSVFSTDGNKRQKPSVNNNQNQRYEIPTKDAHSKDVNIKDTASPTAKADSLDKKDEPMTLKEFIDWCSKSSQRHIRIIGNWAETTEPNLKTKKQWESFIKRNLRAAKNLEPFEDKQLIEAFGKIEEAVKEGWLKKYTLETLHKFIV